MIDRDLVALFGTVGAGSGLAFAGALAGRWRILLVGWAIALAACVAAAHIDPAVSWRWSA